jgi:hypothetical protein
MEFNEGELKEMSGGRWRVESRDDGGSYRMEAIYTPQAKDEQ